MGGGAIISHNATDSALRAYVLLKMPLIHCVSKNISNVFDCNLVKDYQISIIFGTDIPKITGHGMTI